MFLTLLIVIVSLLFLVTIHELGHFILAKKFGVKVEEFGIGIPPKIIGKKIGETVYSLNLLPIGAFVKLYGEEERIEKAGSFTQKPIWQRALIVLGGVVTFWIIAVILMSIISGVWGIPMAIGDEDQGFKDPKVQIIEIAKDSPAEKVGLRMGDIIQQLKTKDNQIVTTKVKEVTDFTDAHRGEEITLTIKRGKEAFNISLVSRQNPPQGEGAMGVALVRAALKIYPWSEAIIQGFLITKDQTISTVFILGNILSRVVRGIPIPKGQIEFKGIVGISQIMAQTLERGVGDYLWLLSMISIFLALFNILPIPALDGGKLLFLGIEKIRRKPVSQKTEQRITTFFFILLMALSLLITIKDIRRIF
jgi:regulator of sigma E protease